MIHNVKLIFILFLLLQLINCNNKNNCNKENKVKGSSEMNMDSLTINLLSISKKKFDSVKLKKRQKKDFPFTVFNNQGSKFPKETPLTCFTIRCFNTNNDDEFHFYILKYQSRNFVKNTVDSLNLITNGFSMDKTLLDDFFSGGYRQYDNFLILSYRNFWNQKEKEMKYNKLIKVTGNDNDTED